MDKPRNAEEQAFWDNAALNAMHRWADHATAKAFRGHKIPTIAEFSGNIADELLEERRKRVSMSEELSNASP